MKSSLLVFLAHIFYVTLRNNLAYIPLPRDNVRPGSKGEEVTPDDLKSGAQGSPGNQKWHEHCFLLTLLQKALSQTFHIHVFHSITFLSYEERDGQLFFPDNQTE